MLALDWPNFYLWSSCNILAASSSFIQLWILAKIRMLYHVLYPWTILGSRIKMDQLFYSFGQFFSNRSSVPASELLMRLCRKIPIEIGPISRTVYINYITVPEALKNFPLFRYFLLSGVQDIYIIHCWRVLPPPERRRSCYGYIWGWLTFEVG